MWYIHKPILLVMREHTNERKIIVDGGLVSTAKWQAGSESRERCIIISRLNSSVSSLNV